MVFLPIPLFFQVLSDLLDGLAVGQPVEPSGLDHVSVFDKRVGHGLFIQLAFLGMNDDPHGQIVFPGEIQVPLVVSGHGHDRSGPVFQEDEIRHPDRDLFFSQGVHRVTAREYALFLRSVGGTDVFVDPALLPDEFEHLGLLRRPCAKLLGHGVFRREDHERGPE